MSDFSTILFARPSFLEGMGRILDFGGFMDEYNTAPTGPVADYYALQADWAAVGQDFYAAIDQVQREIDGGQITEKKKSE